MEVRYKRGDVREDGRVFWAYRGDRPNRERWLSEEKFVARLAHDRQRKSAYNKRTRCARNAHERNRRSRDPLFALAANVRRRVRGVLKSNGFVKNARTFDILGCSFEDLMAHLENQFTEGMAWENRGEWHVDHIIPLASANTEEDILALSHYTNLQPLWAVDNLSKGAKW